MGMTMIYNDNFIQQCNNHNIPVTIWHIDVFTVYDCQQNGSVLIIVMTSLHQSYFCPNENFVN